MTKNFQLKTWQFPWQTHSRLLKHFKMFRILRFWISNALFMELWVGRLAVAHASAVLWTRARTECGNNFCAVSCKETRCHKIKPSHAALSRAQGEKQHLIWAVAERNPNLGWVRKHHHPKHRTWTVAVWPFQMTLQKKKKPPLFVFQCSCWQLTLNRPTRSVLQPHQHLKQTKIYLRVTFCW